MWKRAWLLSGLLALVAVPACAEARTLRQPSAARVRPLAEPVAPRPPVPGRPAPVAAAPAVPGGAASGATTFSTTNVQEQGVDEPDIVKTDGSRIFAVSRGTLYALAVGGDSPQLVGSLPLGAAGDGAQLLLRGNRLIVISGRAPVAVGVGFARPVGPGIAPPPGGMAPSPYYYGGHTTVTEVNVHDPSTMKVTRTMTIDGTFVDARQNGASARLVISSAPRALAAAGARARPGGWVPARSFRSFLSGRRYVRAVAACDEIRRPVQFSGLGVVTILTFDLDRGLWASDSAALMADAQIVYGSQRSLYVATQRWIDPRTAPERLPASQTTVIDRFDASRPDRTTFVSAGEVPGFLLNQFSLSEHRGYLRAATTSRPIWWSVASAPPASQSFVTVLANRGGVLAPVGQVSGLGVGQQIRSVRFVGDSGYVVTFRNVDPLYTIDLRSPSGPRVAGQLELQGFSAYLHPLGGGLLLGVGQASGSAASGTQLELFDVSNPSAPTLLARTALGFGSSSEVSFDHHAFLYCPPTSLAVLPVQIYAVSPPPTGPPTPVPAPASPGSTPSASGGGASSAPGYPVGGGAGFVGAIGFRVDRSGIAEVGRVAHDPDGGYAPPIRRSLVIGERLFTLSESGVMASRLDDLARQGFVAFPAAPPSPTAGSARPSAR
jgi:hypothetical protein